MSPLPGTKATAFILRAGETKPVAADGGVSLPVPSLLLLKAGGHLLHPARGRRKCPDRDSVAPCEGGARTGGGDLPRSVQGLGREPTRDLREKGFYSLSYSASF